MVNRFLNVASIFFIIIQVLPAVLQPALLCMQFADSAGNIAAGALIQTNTLLLYFLDFSSVLTDILRGRELYLVTD
jgi:hypothetical protein